MEVTASFTTVGFIFYYILILPFVSSKIACYGEGQKRVCFSNRPPFHGLPLPEDPIKKIPPVYFLTRGTPQNVKIINSSLEINVTQGLVVIIHGWMGSYGSTEEWRFPLVRNLLAIKPSTDILFVDWERGARLRLGFNPYDLPAVNARAIAAVVVNFLLENRNFSANEAHCIGFSLGSHACGFAGKRLKAAGASSVGWGRVTALDPAFPNFDKKNRWLRVDRTDGEFVDVIHTSRLGLSRSVGDVDFFVSGATTQPGCSLISGRRRRRRHSVLATLMDWTYDIFGCSHVRAALIYAETILAQPNYNLSGVISDVTRYGPRACTFSKFCPCSSLENYDDGNCRQCEPATAQIIGYWSFMRKKFGSFYGELSPIPPYCVGN